MLDQLFSIVKQFGQDTVVNNPDVPNDYNQEVMADATETIAGGFKNILAGGGLQNILDLFKDGGNAPGDNHTGGSGGLLKNPIVTMMTGYFISKLVKKYSMSPSAASNVANSLIPNALRGLIEQTKDPANASITMDGFIGSLVGRGADDRQGQAVENSSGSPLQDLLDKFTGGTGNTGSAGGGFDLQDIISQFTRKSQDSFQKDQVGGGSLVDLIRGFIK